MQGDLPEQAVCGHVAIQRYSGLPSSRTVWSSSGGVVRREGFRGVVTVFTHKPAPACLGCAVTSPLELLTFEDLVSEIEQKIKKSITRSARAGWGKLLDVAQSLAGRSDADIDPAVGQHWKLVRISVSGYQGIATEPLLKIEFDPNPGITILHGPNGSGKSSIADAIETALRGKPREPMPGTGGKEPLWERRHCGRDATEAIIELELVSRHERLKIRCRLNSESRPVEHNVILYRDGTAIPIELSSTTWKSALAAHNPVFEYAAVERRVQTAQNLQEFLDSFLAFGECFNEFKQEVDRHSKKSQDAKARWSTAWKSAKQKVDEVDTEHRQEGQQDLATITWPEEFDPDPDAWLSREGLTETGAAALPEVTEECHHRLVVAGNEASEALTALAREEDSLHARLAGPLKQLQAAACEIGDKGSICPVCATSEVNWFAKLTDSVDNLANLAALTSVTAAMQQKLKLLRTATNDDLGIIHEVLRDHTQPENGILPGVIESKKFLTLLERDGHNATPEVRSAMGKLCAWIQSRECLAIVEDAQQESDRQRQWRRARGAAVDGFVSVWREVGTDAHEATGWDSANKCLRELKQMLREKRTESLRPHTEERVRMLLADFGLTLSSIKNLSTKASIGILDETSKEMTLAMLSAGQRNALLLSPLLAASRAGPFGFLVLDDPVHAFDQIRVDCLAKILHDLATERRIIVLTHEERLHKHLVARDLSTELRAVSRNPRTGVVTADPQDEMWSVLLDNAEEVLKKSLNSCAGRTDMVRNLCRLALENALRQFVIRACFRLGHESEICVNSLDEAKTTAELFDLARNIHENDPGSNAVDIAKSHVFHYLLGWNRAAHGNLPESKESLQEVSEAREACKTLVGSAP